MDFIRSRMQDILGHLGIVGLTNLANDIVPNHIHVKYGPGVTKHDVVKALKDADCVAYQTYEGHDCFEFIVYHKDSVLRPEARFVPC